jgi:two-component sensor histidine kinase
MLVFALVALPPTLMGIVEAFQASRVHAERLRDSVRSFAALASTYQLALIENSTSLLLDLSVSKEVFSSAGLVDDGRCAATLARAIRPYPAYASLVVLDRRGVVACANDAARRGFDASQESYFQQAVAAKRRYLSGYVMGPEPPIPMLVLAQPVMSGTDHVEAVLALAIRLDKLDSGEQFLTLPDDGVVYLLDRNGLMLHGTTVPAGLGDSGLPPASEIAEARASNATTFQSTARDGVSRVYAVSVLENGSLFVLVGVPRAGGSGWIDRDLAAQILLVTAIWVSGVLAAWLGTRLLVTRWTGRLFVTTSALGRGNLSARADLDGAPAEIKQLGDTLAEMATRLDARQNELTAALEQKEDLLREIHHRIKNNLQTVTSLLNLYSRGIQNEPAKQSLQEVRIRVQALALVHRHLYENPEHRWVNVRALLGELCQLIQVSSGISRARVALSVNVASVDIGIEHAVPLALLVTELVTNSFKHGFPENRRGAVNLLLTATPDGIVELTVSDDGIGVPSPPEGGPDIFATQTASLGFSLVRGFAAQLGAEIKTQSRPGTSVHVRFHLKPRRPEHPSADDEIERTARSATG